MTFEDVGGLGRADQAGARARPASAEISARLSAARNQRAARDHSLRPARLGQDAPRARGRQRGRGAVLLHQRTRDHRYLCRRDRGQSAAHLRRSRPSRTLDRLHRRARRARAQARRDRRALRHSRGDAAPLADGRPNTGRLRDRDRHDESHRCSRCRPSAGQAASTAKSSSVRPMSRDAAKFSRSRRARCRLPTTRQVVSTTWRAARMVSSAPI